MKLRCLVIVSLVCILALTALSQPRKRRGAPSPSPTPSNDLAAIAGVKLQQGPSIGTLGDTAQVRVPAGYVFAGANDTRTVMEAFHNPTNGREMGLVAPAGDDWFAVLEF